VVASAPREAWPDPGSPSGSTPSARPRWSRASRHSARPGCLKHASRCRTWES